MSEDEPNDTLGLDQVLDILRRRAKWIVLCVVVIAGGAFFVFRQQPKKYTATASLVFDNSQISQEIAGVAAPSNDPTAQQQTNVELLTLGPTASETATAIGGGLTAGQVAGSLSVTARGLSNVVDLSVTWSSPTLAALIANTYAKRFADDQLSSSHSNFGSALTLVNRQLRRLSPAQRRGPEGLTLRERAQSLQVLSQLRSGDVQIAKVAGVPGAPSSPRLARDTGVAAVLGLLIAIALALLIERLDRRIRDPSDLASIYGLPLLGVVPVSRALAQAVGGLDRLRGRESAPEAEVFHMLRAHLKYFNVSRQLRTLAVVSPAPGDGKTTIAWNLAQAVASMGTRTLLMETDLRRATLSQRLPLIANAGLAGVLSGELSLQEAVQAMPLDADAGRDGNAGARALDVLVAGDISPPNPAELIESQAMRDLLASVSLEYGLVVIDTPPLAVVADAFPLLSQVDGVIVVGRVGRDHRSVAVRLHQILSGTQAPLLGVVANGVKKREGESYGYAYSYGSGAAGRRRGRGRERSPNGRASPAQVAAVPRDSGSDE